MPRLCGGTYSIPANRRSENPFRYTVYYQLEQSLSFGRLHDLPASDAQEKKEEVEEEPEEEEPDWAAKAAVSEEEVRDIVWPPSDIPDIPREVRAGSRRAASVELCTRTACSCRIISQH